ncbi:MAG: AAA family ATPase [Collinsella sp.]
MILRDMKKKLLQLATKFPVVSVTGPRQSGKSTLIKARSPRIRTYRLKTPRRASCSEADPTNFLKRYSHNVIFDEAQRAPELFSYLQGMVDGRDEPGSFIISGSQNFLLSKSVSQSLAGRVGILRLLPLSHGEIVRGAQRSESAWSWAYRARLSARHRIGYRSARFLPRVCRDVSGT